MLEKAFVVIRLSGFSRNLRKEIRSKSKYNFVDNGIRNAIIAQFNELDLRNDVGSLWENFIFMERLKYRTYQSQYANMYFWRTYDKQEIDLIEEYGGNLHGNEFKWSTKKLPAVPRLWQESYPQASFTVIHPDNYHEFIVGDGITS